MIYIRGVGNPRKVYTFSPGVILLAQEHLPGRGQDTVSFEKYFIINLASSENARSSHLFPHFHGHILIKPVMLSGWPESIYLLKRCRWWAKRVDRMGRWVELHQHPMKVKNNQTFCTFSHRLSFGHKILPKNPSSTSSLRGWLILWSSLHLSVMG